MTNHNMTFHEHVAELRKRLIYIICFFALALVGAFFLAEPVITYLQHTEEAAKLQLNAFRLTDPLKVYMQTAFIIACVLTSPFILYQIWAFVAPGLYEKERKITLTYIPVSVILFTAGSSFSSFILFPFVVHFITRISNELDLNQVIGINEYFCFYFN